MEHRLAILDTSCANIFLNRCVLVEVDTFKRASSTGGELTGGLRLARALLTAEPEVLTSGIGQQEVAQDRLRPDEVRINGWGLWVVPERYGHRVALAVLDRDGLGSLRFDLGEALRGRVSTRIEEALKKYLALETELRQKQNEVNQLWNKEEHHSFAEMSQDSYHRKRHTCKVAKCVSNKYF